MIGKSPNQDQGNMFLPILKEIVNPEHERERKLFNILIYLPGLVLANRVLCG